MSFKTVKLRAAQTLLKSRMFVLLTDKEAIIAIDGADPHSFQDAISLAAQQTELELFHDKLGDVIKDHRKILEEISGVTNEKKTTTTSKTSKPVKTTKAKKSPRSTQAKTRRS